MLSLTRLCPPSVSLLTPTRTAKAFLGYSIIHSSKNAPCFASNSFLHRPQSLFQSLTMTKKRSLATQENSGAAKRTKTVEEMATVVENTSKVERNGGQEIDIVTFNVNGIRAAVKKGLLSFVEEANADIICFNEVKATLGDVTEVVDGLKELDYQHYCWNASETKKGYAGTAVFSKIEPIRLVLYIAWHSLRVHVYLLSSDLQ